MLVDGSTGFPKVRMGFLTSHLLNRGAPVVVVSAWFSNPGFVLGVGCLFLQLVLERMLFEQNGQTQPPKKIAKKTDSVYMYINIYYFSSVHCFLFVFVYLPVCCSCCYIMCFLVCGCR